MKDVLFTACPQKTCCLRRVVPVTEADVSRITTAMALPRHSVVMETGTGDVLARTEDGCRFLLELPDGLRRCGLGELRPMACRTFPCSLRDGLVVVDRDEDCTCRAWSLADVDAREERALLEQAAAESA